jgi:uncharacterized protein YraI
MKTLGPVGLLWGIGIILVSPIAQANSECATHSGDSVVVNVGPDDPIGGLAVRAAPSPQAPIKTVIPAAGTGVAIGSCHGDGWCEVTFECVRGWSLAARYLAPRDQRLYRVTNVSPNDPEGLNVRSGPGLAYSPKGNIPYNGDGIVLHDCQADGRWCLVTYGEISGWSARQLLAPMTVAVATAPTAPNYSAPPPATGAGNDDSVPITMIHNSIHVVVTVSGRPLDMVLDTGANVSSIPPSLANNLIAAGRAEEGPSVPITLANGATEKERTVFIDSLVIGRHARAKVLVSVSDGDPLLGLPILNAIGKFSIDAEHGVLSFEGAVSASE